MEDKLLTYAELATFLSMPVGTVYYLVHRRQIPFVRLGRRLVRFRRSQIEQWLISNTGVPAEDGRTLRGVTVAD